MKHQKFKILLIFICISTFQVLAQKQIDRFSHTLENDSLFKSIHKNIELLISVKNDSVKIYKPQIKNIYIGLKQSEQYKEYYYECLQISNQLNQVINNQDQELKKSLKQITILNSDTEALNLKITASEVEIQRLKNKKTPWYKHPLLYGFIGFVGGVYLIK